LIGLSSKSNCVVRGIEVKYDIKNNLSSFFESAVIDSLTLTLEKAFSFKEKTIMLKNNINQRYYDTGAHPIQTN
jgi:hypothetical protein